MNLIVIFQFVNTGELCALIRCPNFSDLAKIILSKTNSFFSPKKLLFITLWSVSHHSLQVCYLLLKTSAHTIPITWEFCLLKGSKFSFNAKPRQSAFI